ncbi:MAG: polar growth protein [Vezdaea aestivalis]|nr:MAG: polar growth protein [Vezdaea aestivalis]
MAYRPASMALEAQFPILHVIHDFEARSPDELSLKRGDRIDLIEKDDDFGDGWFLGRHRTNGRTGLFPEVYTTSVPRTQNPVNTSANTNGRPPVRPAPGLDSTLRSASAGTPGRYGVATDAPPPLNTINSSQSIMSSPIVASPASGHVGGRAFSMNAALGHGHSQDSPVMNETLSVIDEHITDMGTPRHSLVAVEHRDSGSEYSGHLDQRISYIPGHETDEEDELQHTRKEVRVWDPSQVAEYLSGCGVDSKQCEVLREQEINGQVLLDLDRSTLLMPEFELGKLGPRLYLWQKVKALQTEVASTAHSRQSSLNIGQNDDQPPRDRSNSERAIEPGNRVRSLQDSNHSASPSPLPLNTARISPTISTRPSAASIRDLNHSRRHSSADFGVGGAPPMNTREPRESTAISSSQTHKKGGSFDRGWTLSSAGAGISRPNSTEAAAFSPSLRQKTPGSTASTAEDALESNAAALENDRGYFSGGEVENRKNRNVLRKSTISRSKNPSYADEQRRRSATASIRQSRVGSADQALDASAAKPSMFGGTNLFRGSSMREVRAAFDSGKRYEKTLTSPTVTKLEYDEPKSGKASPRSNQSSAFGSPDPQSPTKNAVFPHKSRALGLRAISDAVTSGERAAANQESPLQSPSATGSSTPNKSSELDQSSLSTKGSALQTNGKPARNVARRKKSKKDTSAYRRGLVEKTPQEQMVGCEYSGWMKKKSSKFITLWKPRLFILRGRRLSYYYSEDDTKEQGLIDISGYRVMAAANERVAGLHAALTRAAASPASPENATTPTLASQEASSVTEEGMFIFKLTPPRPGYAGTNFTQPEEHYFGCDNAAQGRAWMAALTKVTIDLDTSAPMTTTYNQATISLAKAKAMKHRPPALRDVDEDADGESKASSTKDSNKDSEGGLGIVLGNGRKSPSPVEAQPEGNPAVSEGAEVKPPLESQEDTTQPGAAEQPPLPQIRVQPEASPVVTA